SRLFAGHGLSSILAVGVVTPGKKLAGCSSFSLLNRSGIDQLSCYDRCTVEDRKNTTGVSMLEFSDKPVLQAKPFQKRLLWKGSSVIAILLFTIIFRLMRARAGKMLQPPQQANEVLAVITNSGSTNTPGSWLTIMKDGSG